MENPEPTLPQSNGTASTPHIALSLKTNTWRKKLKSVKSKFYTVPDSSLFRSPRDSKSSEGTADIVVPNLESTDDIIRSRQGISLPVRKPSRAKPTRDKTLRIRFAEEKDTEPTNGGTPNGTSSKHKDSRNGRLKGKAFRNGRVKNKNRKAKEPEPETVAANASKDLDRADSIMTVSTIVDARTVFRAWSEGELKLQREVIEKYEAGARLWTKAGLAAMEEKIKTRNPIALAAFAGEGQTFEKQAGLAYQVEFHGFRDLAFPPPSRPDDAPYCPLSIRTLPFDYALPHAPGAAVQAFHRCTAAWLGNPVGHHLYSLLMRLPLPPRIDRVVCFNLGCITAKPANDHSRIRRAMYKHAAALTIVEALHRRFGTMIQLFAQDTSYSSECTDVLYKKGFSVVGMHGAGGFAEVNERTLVFAPDPGFCVKEVVADTVEPAAMFWTTVLSPEDTERSNRSHRPLAFDDDLTAYWELHDADPDTPRVRALVRKYDRHTFPLTNLLGEVSLYTHKGISVTSVSLNGTRRVSSASSG
ncbi:hypothetical protein F4677DRAFT_31862 [Hypoxylon crocopeplum]|nr:hypothetical protein F4677DRAFT_31862 [Hypoxylon crocopeplum]